MVIPYEDESSGLEGDNRSHGTHSVLRTLPCPLYWFPRAATGKYHRLSGLKYHTFIFHTLEARCLPGRCPRGWFLLEALRGRLFHASPQFPVAARKP